MKEYSPAPKRGAATVLSVIGILCAALCTYLGSMTSKTFLFFCFSCTLVLFSLQLMFRFCFTQYTYIISDGVLIVATGFGERRNTIFTISLRAVYSICDKSEMKSEKERYEIKYNVCQNLSPDRRCRLSYNNGKSCCVYVECDKEFFADELTALI